ncbi:unnamed protein product [Didymodactylos carnosus]|uniref:Uncharacterized protein n=1 Tax=Didymodactylos carnosus TaxID=1234261 RepID=A0A8S2UMJ5_9BILA|nr:unnamed protein product [Didymodactylos carnosus]
MPSLTPFYSKGRGRSHMLSDFLVAHPSGPFFALTHSEYLAAKLEYPTLEIQGESMFRDNSASAGITVGKDDYFDSKTVLNQFERLCQLLKFKTEYQGHDVEVLVDNARTHSAKQYSVNDFGKGIGTRCPVEDLEFLDADGEEAKLSCYFGDGENKNKSKGFPRFQSCCISKCDETRKASKSIWSEDNFLSEVPLRIECDRRSMVSSQAVRSKKKRSNLSDYATAHQRGSREFRL